MFISRFVLYFFLFTYIYIFCQFGVDRNTRKDVSLICPHRSYSLQKSMEIAPFNETRIRFVALKEALLLVGLPLMDAGILRSSINGSIKVYFQNAPWSANVKNCHDEEQLSKRSCVSISSSFSVTLTNARSLSVSLSAPLPLSSERMINEARDQRSPETTPGVSNIGETPSQVEIIWGHYKN